MQCAVMYSNVFLTFESYNVPWCDHSNETSSAVHVVLHGNIYFSILTYKMKFGIFLEVWFFWHSWESWRERVK